MSRKELINLLIVAFLIVAIPIGVMLLRQQQILRSKASVQPIQFTGPNIQTIDNKPVAISENIQIVVNSPLESITPTPIPSTAPTTSPSPTNPSPTLTGTTSPSPTQTSNDSTPYLEVAEWKVVNGQNIWLRAHPAGQEFTALNETTFLQIAVGRKPHERASGLVTWSGAQLYKQSSEERDSGIVGASLSSGSFNPTPSNSARALGASDGSNPSSIRGKKYRLTGGVSGPVGNYLDVAEWKIENGQNVWLRAHNLNQEFTVGQDTSFIQVGVGISPAQNATGVLSWNSVKLLEAQSGLVSSSTIGSANASGSFTSTSSTPARSLGSYSDSVAGKKFKLEGSVR